MGKINVMPKYLAELIAAGEVVERPASIVKELLENSIDAGADTITLEIKNGGITYIRITDNGSGIAREDMRTAFISHATSKISTADDLNSIMTLGFRGEALPSIAAVARVEVLSSTEQQETGTRYSIEFGEEVLIDDAGCPRGTTITVRDLFMKTPARMKFLKKDVTEANAVAAVVDRTAVSNPSVSFRFIRDGKQTLFTSGKGDLLTCIREVFGKEFASQLIPCGYEQSGVSVSGFISKPEFSRPNRNMQYFFLNGRYVKTGTGAAAVSEGYRNSIMAGKFPSCVLNIRTDPSAVDVNVHPAKTEVRFNDERPVFNAVYSAVKAALSSGDTPHQIQRKESRPFTFPVSYTEAPPAQADQIKLGNRKNGFWQNVSVKQDSPTPEREEKKAGSKPEPFVKPEKLPEPEPYNPPAPAVQTEPKPSPEKIIPEDDAGLADLLLSNPPAERKNRSKTPDLSVYVEDDDIPETPAQAGEFEEEYFRLIGEAFSTYIICEYKKKIIIIDKHAAHERIIYERLKSENAERSNQVLLVPAPVALPKEEYAAVLDNLDIINESGFEVEDFGNGTVIVRECPMELSFNDVPEIIAEIAGRFVEKKQDVMFEKLDWIYHSVACRSAVKAGNFTSEYEMEIFAKQLLSMPEIRYCPHGRPVLIEMTQRELEKNFGRV